MVEVPQVAACLSLRDVLWIASFFRSYVDILLGRVITIYPDDGTRLASDDEVLKSLLIWLNIWKKVCWLNIVVEERKQGAKLLFDKGELLFWVPMNIVVNFAFARLIELAHSLPLCLGFAQFFDRCLKHSAIKLLRLKVKSETINIS